LSDYDWGPSSSQATPAGQDGGAYTELWPNTQHIANPATSDHSLQDTEQNDDSYQEYYPDVGAETSGPSTTTQSTSAAIQCETCLETFQKRYLLNRHIKQKHDRPHKCTMSEECDAAFGLKKDLDRHIRTKHQATGSERYFCPFEECKYSAGQGSGFPRKDNRNRHVQTRHAGQVPLQWPG